jgi:hypothetical protein
MAYVFDARQALALPALCVHTGEPVERNYPRAGVKQELRATIYVSLYIPLKDEYAQKLAQLGNWSLRYFTFCAFLALLVGFLLNTLIHNVLLSALLAFVFWVVFFDRTNKFFDGWSKNNWADVIDAGRACYIVPEVTDPQTGKTYKGWWLIVRDENWAQLVKAKPVLIIPSEPRLNPKGRNIADPSQKDKVPYFYSTQKMPPHPMWRRWIRQNLLALLILSILLIFGGLFLALILVD